MSAFLPARPHAPGQAKGAAEAETICVQFSYHEYRALLRSALAAFPTPAPTDYEEWGDQLEED
ncbi:hypothetical protein [Pseudomonas putida]|uniref:hypothetical protein n=1 Tax=Pseudomonas putida TaxID=303 RepID=UPI000CD48635|nr:hypothetical protein [Pseudomonas putida]POG16956.1 hypothetical protein BGP85_27775 [Pseudomonas putida]